MAYSISEQAAFDIDWYIADSLGAVLHFASAGGRLPNTIMERDNENRELHRLIMGLPLEFEPEINPELDNILTFEDRGLRRLYLRDFIEMARRGIYSFDKSVLGNFDEPNYHLVARPQGGFKTLDSLPDEIKILLVTLSNPEVKHISTRLNFGDFTL